MISENAWAPAETPEEHLVWQPRIFDRSRPTEAAMIAALLHAGKVWNVCDTLAHQLQDLVRARTPPGGLTDDDVVAGMQTLFANTSREDYGRWVYYPWSGQLVHLLPPEEFRELRLDRNRHKVTATEQARLAHYTVGIVGLSVGNAVALTLALEGACGHLKLADFDHLALSNMNRLRAGVHELGLRKTVLAARQIYEMNPYASVSLFHAGLTEANVNDFMLSAPRLDVIIDECDDLRLKLLLRERARARSAGPHGNERPGSARYRAVRPGTRTSAPARSHRGSVLHCAP